MTPVIHLTTIICLVVILIIVIHLIITQIFLIMILIISTMTIIVTVTIAKLWTTIIRKTIVLLQINIKEVMLIADLIIKLTKLRLQLVKSLVIVIYFFETEMRDAVIIINYCCIAALQGKAVAKCRSCSVDGQLIESRKFYI